MFMYSVTETRGYIYMIKYKNKVLLRRNRRKVSLAGSRSYCTDG